MKYYLQYTGFRPRNGGYFAILSLFFIRFVPNSIGTDILQYWNHMQNFITIRIKLFELSRTKEPSRQLNKELNADSGLAARCPGSHGSRCSRQGITQRTLDSKHHRRGGCTYLKYSKHTQTAPYQVFP